MENNRFKEVLFIIIVFIFIFGGYILMKQSTNLGNKNEVVNNLVDNIVEDIRTNTSLDYIYYSDRELIVDELDIEYKNVNINFNDPNNVAQNLNDETKKLKETLVYDETLEDSAYNKLVSAKYKKYEIINFEDYLSLIVNYYTYTSEELVTYLSTTTYVFDKNTGNLYKTEDLLSKFNLTIQDVNEKIETHINDLNLLKDEEKLDATSTVENITEYALYVDKIGRLCISVLVKSSIKDYNEVIILS